MDRVGFLSRKVWQRERAGRKRISKRMSKALSQNSGIQNSDHYMPTWAMITCNNHKFIFSTVYAHIKSPAYSYRINIITWRSSLSTPSASDAAFSGKNLHKSLIYGLKRSFHTLIYDITIVEIGFCTLITLVMCFSTYTRKIIFACTPL